RVPEIRGRGRQRVSRKSAGESKTPKRGGEKRRKGPRRIYWFAAVPGRRAIRQRSHGSELRES
ncbi:unnamed protein product, partial [Bubo scandiacus]